MAKMFENMYGVIIRDIVFGQVNIARVSSSSSKMSPSRTCHLGSFLLGFGLAVTSLEEDARTVYTACPSSEAPGCTYKFIQRTCCMIIQPVFSFSSITCLWMLK